LDHKGGVGIFAGVAFSCPPLGKLQRKVLMEPSTEIMLQFYGAVKNRIEEGQKAFWSHIIGAGFLFEDIEEVWPECNMQFFSMRYAGQHQHFRLADLNLRELRELKKWLESKLYP
jgi:hypothetical protein